MPTQAPVAFPLGAPAIVNNQLTVDTALKQPNRISRRIADITLHSFIVDKIFATSGVPVVGGAMRYQQAIKNELYLANDVEQRGDSDEYPIVGSERLDEKVALVEDWGGKFWVSDNAVKRNDAAYFDIQTTQLSNTIVKKVNTRAVATLDSAIAALGGATTFVGNNWATAQLGGTNPTPNQDLPHADLAFAQRFATQEELGVKYDLWLLNPVEKTNIEIAYGAALAQILATNGITLFASNEIPAGVAYAVATGQVGFLDYEVGLTTETWREQKTRKNWVQSYVQPVMGVTNPYAIRKVTGLAG
ncbi:MULTISPECIES: major capsid protein [unclassified Rhodococcus (in: high G+C Gram-positive bacteria)]|uniref:major capsid protein n=1 Tax=unclassified Rhodococcus (in: high G+C Gram-positive bacteria) TaxID=192944 RepID=UPI000B9BBED2|nr:MULTISPECIES: major capsid protein [unclassified Rhodococcus (in: high G+C Gram-positive bacteria)]OZE35610.1 hypothetical protein CH259_16410 [Rhodococcus sp. 05-2254-4]OZE48039.1 hypothetical protein CH261_09005 [Rhodococcus sp. 05-2254-3]OZE49250.1 hypothetical protein CH283_16790 [Rhodococcus sp. 05-2254-2]